MNPSNEPYNELLSISPLLAGMEKLNPFSVPEGYFESFPAISLIRSSSPILANDRGFAVPEGYFENLSGLILEKIKKGERSRELNTISPWLSDLQSENVFSVPTGYFENFAAVILSKVSTPKAIIKTMGKRSVWQYAAAAVVSGIIMASSLWIGTKSADSSTAQGNDYAAVEVTGNKILSEAKQYSSVSDITREISTLPKDDILQYLDKTSTDADLEILASSLNTKELPEPEDYLLDEQALNNYLEKNEASRSN